MANEILNVLIRANIAASAAILIVLALRAPIRLMFGARIAYALWIMALLVPIAVVMPPRAMSTLDAALPHISSPLYVAQDFLTPDLVTVHAHQSIDLPHLLILLWIIGAVTSVVVVNARQIRFWRSLGQLQPSPIASYAAYVSEINTHSPLVAGVLRSKIVLPADFLSRFSNEERVLVLAHEAVHIRRHDTQINLLVAAFQCLNWFNPLIHFAAHQMRLDQEFACDADVLAANPGKRHLYAQAMLKNVLSPSDVPVGCSWPSRSVGPLKKRIALLNLESPSRFASFLGVGLVAVTSLTSAYAAWASQPSTKQVTAGTSEAASSASARKYREMTWGNLDAPVSVVEYASLTCGHCAHFSTDVFPRIKQAYIDSGKVRFVYRDFPIDNLAMGAALISRCAPEDTGKKLIATMFRNLRDWQTAAAPLEILKQYAAQAGIGSRDVDVCLQNQVLLTALQTEQRDASVLHQVKATPTFLIGDEKLEGIPGDSDQAYGALSTIIERQLKKAR